MNPYARGSCLVVLVFVLTGCDVIYRMLDKEGAEEKELVGEAMPYERNPTVEEIQTLLEIYGYNPGKPDGILGVRTRNAIERFQADQGLKTTRFVDEKTWALLKVFVDEKWIVDGSINTRLVQETLKAEGFDPGPIDGKFGSKTKAAVMNFQKARGLKVDGKVGYQTLSALSSYRGLDGAAKATTR